MALTSERPHTGARQIFRPDQRLVVLPSAATCLLVLGITQQTHARQHRNWIARLACQPASGSQAAPLCWRPAAWARRKCAHTGPGRLSGRRRGLAAPLGADFNCLWRRAPRRQRARLAAFAAGRPIYLVVIFALIAQFSRRVPICSWRARGRRRSINGHYSRPNESEIYDVHTRFRSPLLCVSSPESGPRSAPTGAPAPPPTATASSAITGDVRVNCLPARRRRRRCRRLGPLPAVGAPSAHGRPVAASKLKPLAIESRESNGAQTITSERV